MSKQDSTEFVVGSGRPLYFSHSKNPSFDEILRPFLLLVAFTSSIVNLLHMAICTVNVTELNRTMDFASEPRFIGGKVDASSI